MQAPDILAAATSALVDRARTRDDGRERSMKLAVGIWSAMTGLPMDELDGWRFMLALKLARAARGQCSTDDWIDLAGYAALAGECQSEGTPQSAPQVSPRIAELLAQANIEVDEILNGGTHPLGRDED